MILVTNITKGTQSECDAIETLTLDNGEYIPVDPDKADGFAALTIIHVSPSEEYYEAEYFVFDGHEMKGNEDVGEYEFIPEPAEEAL